jgi:hypothetical protein
LSGAGAFLQLRFGECPAQALRGDLEVLVERARGPHRGAIAFAMTAKEDDAMRLTFRETDIGMSRKSALRSKYFAKSTIALIRRSNGLRLQKASLG